MSGEGISSVCDVHCFQLANGAREYRIDGCSQRMTVETSKCFGEPYQLVAIQLASRSNMTKLISAQKCSFPTVILTDLVAKSVKITYFRWT